MRFLVRVLSPGVPPERALSSVRALARMAGSEARNAKWTSYGALEIDIFSPTRADFDVLLSVLAPLFELEFYRDLNAAPPHRSEDAKFAEAKSYFNSERYWECHEVLEEVWRNKSGAEKRLLQGIILVCAAFVHHQKGEQSVALGVLRRAEAQLEIPASGYHALDLATLVTNTKSIVKTGKFYEFKI